MPNKIVADFAQRDMENESGRQKKILDLSRKRYKGVRLEPMDVVVFAHLGVVGILVVPFHHDVHRWFLVPFVHAGLCLLILEGIRWNSIRRNGPLDFVRTFYPVLWNGFAWMEINNLATMIFPYWGNAFVVGLDLRIFGVHPTVWVQSIFRPWLTELMNFFYFSYYFFIPLAVLPLYFGGRRRETFDFLFIVTFAVAVCLILFLFIPAEGAWVVLKSLHTVQPEGGFFLHMVRFLQARGTVRGGAFPSLHVTAAFVTALAAMRYRKKTGLLMLFLAAGMALSTVYCRYHHAVDAMAGIVLGPCLYAIGVRILKRRGTA
jgi:membrane-associated phospholipid phosphatase